MRNLIVGIVVGVVVGIVVGTTVVAPRLQLPVQTDAELKAKPPVRPHLPEPAAQPATRATSRTATQTAPQTAEPAQPNATPATQMPARVSGAHRPPSSAKSGAPRRWRMASTYPSTMAELGGLGKRLEETIYKVSGGALQIAFFEPGTLVATDAALEAVKSGAIEAVFASPGLWAAENPVLHLFSGIPFGPPIQEYLAWLHADGNVLLAEGFEKLGVHAMVCGLLAPEGSGWFRRKVDTLDELKRLNVGMRGLGGRVLAKLGVNVTPLAEGDVFVALERGIIDGAAAAQPSIDLELGLYRMARHYYFPGWHQPAGTLVLVVNRNSWQALDTAARAQLESVCGDNVTHGLGESEASQFGALKALSARDVSVENWSPEILNALRTAWQSLVAEMAAGDKDFDRAWDSLQRFREEYDIWREIGLPAENR